MWGYLPGPLKVRCRAGAWHRDLMVEDPSKSPEFAIDWVNLIALAVNEENAFGGRVVTAPTNGAAGIIPAVLHYAMNYTQGIRHCGQAARDQAVVDFFLASAAVGVLYKKRASISGAEVGCQGEVGSASSSGCCWFGAGDGWYSRAGRECRLRLRWNTTWV